MDTKEKIMGFIKVSLIEAHEGIHLEDSTQLIDMGIIDSMAMIRLLTFLEESFSIKVGDGELIPENFENIESIRNMVEKKILEN